jgi:hypothetical protein
MATMERLDINKDKVLWFDEMMPYIKELLLSQALQ